MKKILSLLLFVSITAFMSCKGDMSDMGPAGQDGIDGQDGNANVKSYVTTISAADWQFFDSHLWLIDLQVPIVTSQIASSGLVMTYLQEANGEWYALPFSRSTQNYFFWAKTEAVRIHSQNDSASPVKFAGKVRVVAVTSEGLMHNPDLDWTDYEAVKNQLQLPE